MISSVAKKTRKAPAADSSRTCSNGESGENKCGNGAPTTESRVSLI